MTYRNNIWKIIAGVMMIFTAIIAGTSQELCEELAREVFEETDKNCAGAANENACYGFDNINATFYEEVEGFSSPSDLVEMLRLQTLRSSEFDPEEEEWGVGYFQIGIEGSDDPLILMATGNVIVENDIEAAQAAGLSPMQALNFTTGGPAQCQQAPNAVYIQSPQNVEVDLIINSTPLRIGSTVIIGTFNNNSDDDQPQGDTMWIAVLEGSVITNPGTNQEKEIPEGNASTVPLTDENGETPNGENRLPTVRVLVINAITGEPVLGPDGEPFYRQIPYEEFEDALPITEDGEGIFNLGNYTFINNIPLSLINYEVLIELLQEETLVEDTSVPVVPVVTEEPVSPVDNNVTECGSLNWCNAGEPWGDGRCNDPDPDVSNWFWTAGWYRAQLECGAIEDIPEEFAPLEQAPVDPGLATAGCVVYESGGLSYVNFNGGNSLGAGASIFYDSSCSISYYPLQIPLVYATSLADAQTICASANRGMSANPDVWEC